MAASPPTRRSSTSESSAPTSSFSRKSLVCAVERVLGVHVEFAHMGHGGLLPSRLPVEGKFLGFIWNPLSWVIEAAGCRHQWLSRPPAEGEQVPQFPGVHVESTLIGHAGRRHHGHCASKPRGELFANHMHLGGLLVVSASHSIYAGPRRRPG